MLLPIYVIFGLWLIIHIFVLQFSLDKVLVDEVVKEDAPGKKWLLPLPTHWCRSILSQGNEESQEGQGSLMGGDQTKSH
jgi:hypothetical protein